MANRVLLGSRSGQYGLWVSKAGSNVLTAGAGNMLMSPDIPMAQVVASDRFTNHTDVLNHSITIPNLGFFPFLLISTTGVRVSATYNSNTSITFTAPFTNNAYDWSYAVLNLPWRG